MNRLKTANDGEGEETPTIGRALNRSIASLVAYVVYLPVSLLTARIMVTGMGLAAYGLWAALTALIGYGGLLDFGFSVSLVKHVAEYRATRRFGDVEALTNTAFFLYLAIGLTALLVMAIPSEWILVHVLHTSASTTMLALYFAVLAGVALSLANGAFRAVILGTQRNDVLAWIDLASNLLNAGTSIIAILLGYGLIGVVWTWTAVIVVTTIGTMLAARSLQRPLRLNPFRFSTTKLREILSFGSRVQVTSLALVLNDQVDRTLIAYALGPTLLGLYQLGSRIPLAVRGASFSLLSGLLPAASHLATTGRDERLRNLCLKATRYVAIVDFGAIAMVVALAGPFVTLWLGTSQTTVTLTMALILVGYTLWLPDQVLVHCLYAIGRPDIRMRADVMFLCIHVPLCVLLIWRFGYYGTLVGTAAALTVTRLYVYVAGSPLLGFTAREIGWKSFLHPAVASALGLAFSLAVTHGVTSVLPALVLRAAVFAAVFTVYVLAFAVAPEERALARTKIHQLRSLLTA